MVMPRGVGGDVGETEKAEVQTTTEFGTRRITERNCWAARVAKGAGGMMELTSQHLLEVEEVVKVLDWVSVGFLLANCRRAIFVGNLPKAPPFPARPRSSRRRSPEPIVAVLEPHDVGRVYVNTSHRPN